MVSAAAYSINEYVLYIVLMYVFILLCGATAYLQNMVSDHMNYRMYITAGLCVWFAISVMFDFRIGMVFVNIGMMVAISIFNIVDVAMAYFSSDWLEDEWYEEEEDSPWLNA